MAIEDLVPASNAPRTGHAPSRVRSMLQVLSRQLQARDDGSITFIFVGGKARKSSQLLTEIDEALAEWQRLDALLVQERATRRHIAARISPFVEFFTTVRRQIRQVERKPRRPLTAQQKVVAAAKLRATRKLRRTMGKRQRATIKA